MGPEVNGHLSDSIFCSTVFLSFEVFMALLCFSLLAFICLIYKYLTNYSPLVYHAHGFCELVAQEPMSPVILYIEKKGRVAGYHRHKV